MCFWLAHRGPSQSPILLSLHFLQVLHGSFCVAGVPLRSGACVPYGCFVHGFRDMLAAASYERAHFFCRIFACSFARARMFQWIAWCFFFFLNLCHYVSLWASLALPLHYASVWLECLLDLWLDLFAALHRRASASWVFACRICFFWVCTEGALRFFGLR